jgi:two-component system, cell cycle sensor histidine kinase and response regulator CckA
MKVVPGVPDANSELNAVLRTARQLAPYAPYLMGLGGLCLLAGWWLADPVLRIAAMISGLGLFALVLLVIGLGYFVVWRDRQYAQKLFGLVAEDAAPCFATDGGGQIVFRNAAAMSRFGEGPRALSATLDPLFASPAAVLYRLQIRAESDGAAREDIVLQSGHIRLSVHRTGPERFFWRLEEYTAEDLRRAPDTPPQKSPAAPEVLADFEHVPVALMSFAPDGTLRIANKAARDLMGGEDLDGAMFHDLFEGLGRPVSDWLADVTAERLPGGVEVMRARRPGEESFLQVTLRRVLDNGEVGALAVLNDATALKTLEAQFVQSQKMQAIGQLAGGIAHDFNNLLTAISGHCDLLLLRHDREDPEYADLVQIHQNANRAASLVNQLLAFSRKQTLKPEQLDLEEVLSELTHLLNRLVGERIGLRLVHGAGLGPIRADKRQLEQVLMNLVVNARDAMPEGGTIRIETEALTLKEELKRDRASVPAGSYAVIRVIDHGTGIPPERIKKIFEPFFTTKRVGEGTGLGLSTAYGIVKQSGGFIFVDSEVGAGTTFQLYFPTHEREDAAPAPEPAHKAAVKPGEGVVLLVEDEAPVRAFAGRALRMRGYTVLEAENAEEALRVLADPSLEVDVFVTDVVMPGMDGPSWVKLALETRPNVKVIFVSGYAEDCLSEDQSRIPNSVFLPKPFSLNDLTATVQGQMQ